MMRGRCFLNSRHDDYAENDFSWLKGRDDFINNRNKTMSKTYTGLIIVLLGWLGLADYVVESEISTLVDGIIQGVGIVLSFYGRYKAGGVNVLGIKN